MSKITNKTIFKNYEKFLNKEIEIEGWIRTVRNSKDFAFFEINDGSFFKNIQIVLERINLIEYDELVKLTIASSVEIKGILVESLGRNQKFEIKAKEITVINKADLDYPLQKKKHSLEYLRTIAHLRPRSNLFLSVFKIRSKASYAIHKFFQEMDFSYIHTPIITGSDCEGAGEMFKVTTLDLENVPINKDNKVDFSKDFFGKEANLTVSGQLSAETFIYGLRNVYTFGPTFRAENSNTTRHISEFWMIEPEMAFVDIYQNMEIAEKMLKYIIEYVLTECPDEIEFLNKFIDKNLENKLRNVLESKFEILEYNDAIKILKEAKNKFEYNVTWGMDLQTEHEKYITQEHFKKPVFVINYPKDIKAFYMKQNSDNKTVAAMDLLVEGIGELIGGSQREENLDKLKSRIEEMNLDVKNYWWYLDLRRYGSVVHSGYGMGFERLVMFLTGVSNIRDSIPFPRTPNNADF